MSPRLSARNLDLGPAPGIDLCLHLVRLDHGAAVAVAAARHAVVPLTREGGRAQYIPAARPGPSTASLHPTLRWLSADIAVHRTLDDIADHAHLAVRTLDRRFREATGCTPVQWVHRERVRQAQVLLETTDLPVELVARRVGSGSATAFRTVFRRTVGITLSRYRATFAFAESGPRAPMIVASPSAALISSLEHAERHTG